MKLSAAIALVVLALFAPPARFLVYLRLALITALVLVASGCAPAPAQLIKPVQVEVTRYVREPIDEKLIRPNEYVKPAPKCMDGSTSVFCNGQLRIINQGLEDALTQCNADKASLRELNAAQLHTIPTTTTSQPGAGEPAPVPAEGDRP